MSIVSVSRRAGPAQRGTGRLDPVGRGRERALALRAVVLDLGQLDRELVLGNRDDSAVGAVDDRDRAAPVALPREQPVAEPVVDGEPAEAARLELVDDPALRGGRGEPVEIAGVDDPDVLGLGDEGRAGGHLGAVGGLDHGADRQVELRRELEVALIVGGDRHDRAGPVLHQHVVGDEHRDPLAVDRVDDGAFEPDAGLLSLLVAALAGRLAERRRRRSRGPRRRSPCPRSGGRGRGARARGRRRSRRRACRAGS